MAKAKAFGVNLVPDLPARPSRLPHEIKLGGQVISREAGGKVGAIEYHTVRKVGSNYHKHRRYSSEPIIP